MRLCNVPLALLPLCFLIAKDDTSANATASPASSEAFSSTGTRSDTLISEPPNARDEERAPGIEDVRGKNKFTTLISKTMQALWKRDTKSQLEVKAAWWRMRNVDPYTVYDNLMLNQIGENILSKPLFHVWFKYVERYNAEHPNDQVPIVRHLLTKYSENKLAMMLQQAKEEGDTLTKILARHCRMSRCQFGLQQMFAHMISTPSRSLARSGWACLRAVRALSGTLISASSTLTITSNKRAGESASSRIASRLVEERYRAGVCFQILMLNKHPEHLLERPEMNNWIRYARNFKKETGKAVTLKKTIKSYYDADAINTIFRTAKTDDGKILAAELAAPQA